MAVTLPRVSLSILAARGQVGTSDQKVLIVGQMLSGTATAGELIRDFPNDGTENQVFGARSHVASMVRELKSLNKVSTLDVLPLDDAVAGTQGTGVITFGTGPAGADATIYVSIGSKNQRKQVDILEDDTITEIGDKVVAAFATDTNAQYTLANAVGVVTATASHKGEVSNEFGINVEGSITDVTIVITAWTGGATNPTLTGVLDVIGDSRYQTIIWPESYDLTEVQTTLDARFNVANAIRDGVAVQIKVDTLANIKTYVATPNSQSIVIEGQRKIDDSDFKGPATLDYPDSMATRIGAIRALRLTEGALLNQFLTTVSSSDLVGGMSASTLPYFNTLLIGTPVASPAHQFSDEDVAELNDAGASMFGPNSSFSDTILGEVVTTYKTDGASNPDDSFKYLNTVDAESTIREYYFNNLRARYSQTRLTAGDLIAGRDMANVSSIRSYCHTLYDVLAKAAITADGLEAKKDYNDNLIISVDLSTGTATIDQAPPLVGQARAFIGTIRVNFGG